MKKLMSKFLLINLFLMLLIFVSCSSSKTESKTGEKVKIAVCMKTMSDTYSNKLGEAIKKYASENYSDIELYLVDAQADVNKQISQAEDMIAKQVDVLILNAQDSDGSAQVLVLCAEAGIPVVEVNTRTSSDDYLSYVGSDDVEAGKIMGNYILEQIGGSGNILILEGNMGQSAQLLRYKGLEETILAENGIKLLSKLSADWARDKSMSITEDWLNKYDDIQAIISENDDMAMGALQAIETMGRDDILIIGVDGTVDALASISEGRLDATVLQDANSQASKVIEVAYKAAKGEKVPKENIVPFQLITKDNIKDFM